MFIEKRLTTESNPVRMACLYLQLLKRYQKPKLTPMVRSDLSPVLYLTIVGFMV